ncbi:MAG: endonuclease V [Nitrososphaeria archaeon]|nr:endonuclease V [Conexivisphaerales archaeon]
MNLSSIDLKKAEYAQVLLARKLRLKGEVEEYSVVGGFDAAYRDDVAAGCYYATLCCTGNRMSFDFSIVKGVPPYVPGFFYLRESKVFFKTVREKPELIFVNAHGIIHPRGFGFASHVGTVLKIPSVGVAKKLLKGFVERDGKVFFKEKQVGWSVSAGGKKYYVSPGNYISLEGSLEVFLKNVSEKGLPWPLYYADRCSKELISKVEKGV